MVQIGETIALIAYASAYAVLVIVIGIYVYFSRKKRPQITPEEKERTYFEQVWWSREIYTAVIVHIYDQATDIAVMVQWYHLAQLELSGNNLESVDMLSFFISGLCFIFLYRIIAMVFAFYEDTKTSADNEMIYHDVDKQQETERNKKSIWIIMWDLLLAVFDLYFIKIVYKEFETGEFKPNQTHRSLQLCEALFESMPQVVLQSVFLLRYTAHISSSSANTLIFVSITASILSIVNKYSWFDRQAVVWDAKEPNGGRKGECYVSWRFLVRNIWRWSDLCTRFVILTLLWVAIGGLYIAIYIGLSYLFYYFVVLNRIKMSEGNLWYRLLATTICFVGILLDYEWHFCILRLIDNGVMLAIISIFVFSTFDCSDIYCSDNNRRDALNTPVILVFILMGFIAYFIEIVTYPILQSRSLNIIKKALQGREFFSIILFGDDTEVPSYYLTYYVDNEDQENNQGLSVPDVVYFTGKKSNEDCEKLGEEVENALKSLIADTSLNMGHYKLETGDVGIDYKATKVFKYGISIKCLQNIYNKSNQLRSEHDALDFIHKIYGKEETMQKMRQIFDEHFKGRDKQRKWVLTFDKKETTFIVLNIDDNRALEEDNEGARHPVVLKYRFGQELKRYNRDIRIINGHDYAGMHIESKQVAIKVIDKRSYKDDQYSKMNEDIFVRERMSFEILHKKKNIGNNNVDILPYIGWDDADDAYFIVTKRLFGPKIADKITSKGGISSRELVQYIRCMYDIISFVHSKGIAMRNISLNSFQFFDDKMYLVHYENSRQISSDAKYGNIKQRAVYLSPELCDIVLDRYKHKKWSQNIMGSMYFASDVWCLGILTYYLILGKHPFYKSGATANKLKKTLKNIVSHKSFDSLEPFKYEEKNKVFTDFMNGTLCNDYKERWSMDKCLSHEFLSQTFINNLDDTEIMKQEIIDVLQGNVIQSKLREAIARVRAEQIEKQEQRIEYMEQKENIQKTDTEIDKLFDIEDEHTIKQQFKRIDLDGDGYTTIDELTKLLTSLGYALNFAQKEAQTIMTTLDLDGDGTIDFNEFAQAWVKRKLTINDKYAHAIFNVFDQNGDGFISIKELKDALFEDNEEDDDNEDDSDSDVPYLDQFFKSIDEDRKDDQLLQILREVDDNKDNKISFDEFHKAMTQDMSNNKDEPHYGNVPFINIFNDISFKDINENGNDPLFENDTDYLIDDKRIVVNVGNKTEKDGNAGRVTAPSLTAD